MDVEQDLRDRQAHQLSVGDLWAASCAPSSRQDFISQHVKSDQQGVEIGGHAATSVVDVGQSNADLRHPSYVSSRPGTPPERNHSSRAIWVTPQASGLRPYQAAGLPLGLLTNRQKQGQDVTPLLEHTSRSPSAAWPSHCMLLRPKGKRCVSRLAEHRVPREVAGDGADHLPAERRPIAAEGAAHRLMLSEFARSGSRRRRTGRPLAGRR